MNLLDTLGGTPLDAARIVFSMNNSNLESLLKLYRLSLSAFPISSNVDNDEGKRKRRENILVNQLLPMHR